MRSALGLSSLLLLLSLAGCKGNSIEGKWTASGIKNLPPGANVTFDFAGGKATMFVTAVQPQAGEMVMTISGPYKVEGEKLTMTADSFNLDDSKLTPVAKAAITQFNIKDRMAQEMKKDAVYTMKFDSSDQVLLTDKSGTATLTRVK